MEIASIGFRAKTGKAVAIALSHGDPSPAYLARWEVVLHDPNIPATSQPHHEVMELPWSDAQAAVRQLELGIEKVATKVVAALMSDSASRSRMGAAAADRCSRRFTITRTAPTWLNLLRSLSIRIDA